MNEQAIYYLVQALLHILAHCITCIFEESGCNCKAGLKSDILSLYAMKEPSLPRQERKSGLEIKPVFFQFALNSVLTKQLILSPKHSQFPHRLFIPPWHPSLNPASFLLAARIVIKGSYFLPPQAQLSFWQPCWKVWKTGYSRCKSWREALAQTKQSCRCFIAKFLRGWPRWTQRWAV